VDGFDENGNPIKIKKVVGKREKVGTSSSEHPYREISQEELDKDFEWVEVIDENGNRIRVQRRKNVSENDDEYEYLYEYIHTVDENGNPIILKRIIGIRKKLKKNHGFEKVDESDLGDDYEWVEITDENGNKIRIQRKKLKDGEEDDYIYQYEEVDGVDENGNPIKIRKIVGRRKKKDALEEYGIDGTKLDPSNPELSTLERQYFYFIFISLCFFIYIFFSD
jgi:hypothetical protein